MLLGMIFRLYSEIFVEIQALFLEILRFEFVTLFVKHPVSMLFMLQKLILMLVPWPLGRWPAGELPVYDGLVGSGTDFGTK